MFDSFFNLKVSFVRVLFLRVLLHIFMYKYISKYEFPCLIVFMYESFIPESFVSESCTLYIQACTSMFEFSCLRVSMSESFHV